jgi:hypothetical protein
LRRGPRESSYGDIDLIVAPLKPGSSGNRTAGQGVPTRRYSKTCKVRKVWARLLKCYEYQ